MEKPAEQLPGSESINGVSSDHELALEIQKGFKNMSEGMGTGLREDFDKKIQQYVDDITSGEDRGKVLQGLPKSFSDAIEKKLELNKNSIKKQGGNVKSENLVPPQYENLPSEIAEEMWTEPIYINNERNLANQNRREAGLAQMRKREEDRETEKGKMAAEKYAQLTEDQKHDFPNLQDNAAKLIAEYLKGTKELENLTNEELFVLTKAEDAWKDYQEKNPGAPLTIKFSKEIDNKVYANLLNRLALEEIKIKKVKAEKENLNKAYEDLGITPHNKESEKSLLEKMNQDEFADWLSNNLTEEDIRSGGIYGLLTIRPENRDQFIKDKLDESRDPSVKGILFQRREKMLSDLKKWSADNENVLRKYGKSKNIEGIESEEGDGWFHYKINESKIPREKDRIKGYISLAADKILEEFNPTVISDILETLKDTGYHGQVKFPSKGSALYDKFDNIVIHGNNSTETQKALVIINDVLKKHQIKTVLEKTGKDGVDEKGKKTSHTDLLAQQVEKTAKERLGIK